MSEISIHQCECVICQQGDESSKIAQHHRMNLFLSQLDEQQRRWYAAVESEGIGHGGQTLVAQITGLSIPTIQRGRRELADNLDSRAAGRVRLPGGGRKLAEKKSPC